MAAPVDLKSKCEKRKIEDNGYLFRHHKVSKSDPQLSFWCCDLNQKNHCNARANVRDGEIVLRKNEHNHAPDPSRVVKTAVATSVKNAAAVADPEMRAACHAAVVGARGALVGEQQFDVQSADALARIFRRKCTQVNHGDELQGKIQEFGLAGRYAAEPDLKALLHALPALAFVPVADVGEAFDLIVHELQADANALAVANYFRDVYVGQLLYANVRDVPMFPPALWNQHLRVLQRMPRTQNGLEGWHSAFNRSLPGDHANVYTFMNAIKKEYTNARVDIADFLAGRPTRLRKNVYQCVERSIFTMVSEYQQRRQADGLLRFVTGIGHNFNF